jgi:hypothetical protein
LINQVQDEPQVVLEAERDTLAEAAQPAHVFAGERADRRPGRAQQERAGQADARKRLIQDAPLQRFDVEDDVRQFRHGRNPRMRVPPCPGRGSRARAVSE